MRRAPLFALVLLSACTTDWGEPNPIFAADEWAEKGCEQHGGTCGGGFFGSCYDDRWRVDDSFICGAVGTLPPSCCFPTDAGPDVEGTADAEVPPPDADEAGLDSGMLEGAAEAAEGGEADVRTEAGIDGGSG